MSARSCRWLLGLVDRHQRASVPGPLNLAGGRGVASDGRIDDEDAESGCRGTDPARRRRESGRPARRSVHALVGIDRRVALLGQRVELLVAVADALGECGVAGPEDAEPVLRVGVVLVSSRRNRGAAGWVVDILAQGDQGRAVSRLDASARRRECRESRRRSTPTCFGSTGNVAVVDTA